VVVAPVVVLEAVAELDATEPDAAFDPDAALAALVDVSDEVVCDDEDEVDADAVVLKPTVEDTVESMVNYKFSIFAELGNLHVV
jgi:hypothetical protein